MNDRQKDLAEMHGTPEQFEKAIWKACYDLFITSDEADAAIKKYREEWDAAGQAPAEAGKPLVGHCGIHRVREPDDMISGHLEYETQTLCGEVTCSDECWQSWAFCPYCGKPFDVPKQAEPLVIGLPSTKAEGPE